MSIEYFTKEETLSILKIKSSMQLWRITKKHNITIFSEGEGRPNFYPKDEITKIAKDKGFSLPKTRKKVEEKKEIVTSLERPILNDIGKNEYIRVKKLLQDRNSLTALDESWLQVYAIAYQSYFSFSYEISKCGGVDVDPAGNKRPSIYIKMASESFKQMDRACSVLGIGSINSQKINAQSEEKDIDPMEALLA